MVHCQVGGFISEGLIKKRESISGVYNRREFLQEYSNAGIEGAESRVGCNEVT